MVAEAIGIQLLKQMDIFARQAGDTAGNAPLLAIFDDGIDGGLLVAAAHREGVDRAAVELGKQQRMVMDEGQLLPTPQIQIHKGKFTAPLVAGKQLFHIGGLVGHGDGFEIDHKITSNVV